MFIIQHRHLLLVYVLISNISICLLHSISIDLLVILKHAFNGVVLCLDLIHGHLHLGLNEELPVADAADQTTLSLLIIVVIDRCLWVYPCLLAVIFATGKPTKGAVDHFLSRFELLAAGGTLLDGLVIFLWYGALSKKDLFTVVKFELSLPNHENL